MWTIEAAIDTQVCQNEITRRVSKVVRWTTEAEVSVELGTQARVVYGEERMKGAWVTNRKAITVFVRGLRGGKLIRKKSCRGSWNSTTWGSSGETGVRLLLTSPHSCRECRQR